MFTGLTILIAEDDFLVALDLAGAVEDLKGKVLGPANSLAEAIALLASENVDAAILDSTLKGCDVTPLAIALVEKGVPVILFTGDGLPDGLAAVHPHLPVVMKPTRPRLVLAALLDRLDAATRG